MQRHESIIPQLMAVIEDRKAKQPAGSYTVKLLDAGAKITEEAAELVEAAANTAADNRPAVTHEAADLVYHLLVMLAECDVSLGDVERELARRFGTSGLEEKASRG